MAKTAAIEKMETTMRSMIYDGVNMSQMEALFGMDYRTIQARIHGVPHHAMRSGVKVWLVRDVVHRLHKPTPQQLEEMIPRMNPNMLPKELSKEFWNALRARAAYLKEFDQLWPTGKVVEVVSRLVKLIKQRVKQRVDTVERNLELSDKLRAMLKESDDALLRELLHAIKEEFKERSDDVEDSREAYILKAFEAMKVPEPTPPTINEDWEDEDDEI